MRIMEIKGTSAYATPQFVQKNFGARYDEWLASLSQASREIMEGVLAYNWYPLYEALVEPTQQICDLFYDGDERGAWDLGKFSADFALKGVYRLFVKIGSPRFVISRASQIYAAYMRPAEMTVPELASKRAVLHTTQVESYWLLEVRMAGWIQSAVEISGGKDVQVEITQSIAKGDSVIEFVVVWK